MSNAPAPRANPLRPLLTRLRELPRDAGCPRRHTPPRPWRPMTDAEWLAIEPYLAPVGPGRPVRDPRGRLDLVFAMTVAGNNRAWRSGYGDLLLHHGTPRGSEAVKGDTLCRQFRRWTQAGLWRTLLLALARTDAAPALLGMAYWILRAARRAMRLMGVAGIALARLLGQLTALPLSSWMLPDPNLSERVRDAQAAHVAAHGWRPQDAPLHRTFESIQRLLWLKRPWSRRLAPA